MSVNEDGTMSEEEWWRIATRFMIIWFVAVGIGAVLLLIPLLL